MSVIAEAQQLLHSRLQEINTEVARLQRALEALDGQPGRAPTRSKGATPATRKAQVAPTARKRKGRKGRGQNAGKLLRLAKANPTAKNTELAKRLNVSPNYVSMMIRELRKKGQLERSKDGQLIVKEGAGS